MEANFDLGPGELIDFAILMDGDSIQCKGRILEVAESRNKVQARVQFTPTSGWEQGKLSRYLHAVARKPLRGEAMSDSRSSLLGTTRHAMRKGVELLTSMFKEKSQDRKLQMVNSWLALLTDMERAVITLRFGFHGEDMHTPESIGAHFGLAPEAICQIEVEAIEKLQRMSQKKEVDLDDVI